MKKRKILIVDDQDEVRELVEATLEAGEYEIFQANNGTSALEVLREHPADLILLDLMMPGSIDGYEVCRRIKACPETSHTLVVMLTARSQVADREKGMSYGADAYFTKPFSPLELLTKLDEIFKTPSGG